MSFFDALKEIGTAIRDTVVSVAEKLGPTIKDTVKELGPMFMQIPDARIRAVAGVLTLVCKVLDLFDDNDTVEDIGDRAIQGEEQGITPEGYDTFDEYMEALRNVELDPEKTEQTSWAEKMAMGSAIAIEGFSEKLEESPEELKEFFVLISSYPDYFNQERTREYLARFDQVGDVVDYFKGNLDVSKQKEMSDQIFEIEQDLGSDESKVRDELVDILQKTRK